MKEIMSGIIMKCKCGWKGDRNKLLNLGSVQSKYTGWLDEEGECPMCERTLYIHYPNLAVIDVEKFKRKIYRNTLGEVKK